ncbi:methyltransferase domain-containing protein [Alphaproteobacteria bacterium]|nr:methyltransferase domain-containing protein [Alphaproteobacteria bacterium]
MSGPHITFRRYYIDQFLNQHKADFSGKVLDIGGERKNSRSNFKPPSNKLVVWIYLNCDPQCAPDIVSDAAQIPLPNEEFDWFLLTEILEHVEDPKTVLKEAFRTLKTAGHGLITMPFLYQVHADPHDYRRWTQQKLKLELQQAGFTVIDISPQGGIFAVIYDLIRSHLYRSYTEGSIKLRVGLKFLKIFGGIFQFFEKKHNHSQTWITTGWSCIVKK